MLLAAEDSEHLLEYRTCPMLLSLPFFPLAHQAQNGHERHEFLPVLQLSQHPDRLRLGRIGRQMFENILAPED